MNSRMVLTALSLAFLLTTPLAQAGDGHDHGDAPAAAAASGNGPRRLPDGSVFLPKPAQRQIGVRTLQVEAGELPKATELSGKVVMDPNAGGKVQAIVAGRVTPGPRGLPLPGQTVKKGEVLAYVTPEVGGNSRSLAESRSTSPARTVRHRAAQDDRGSRSGCGQRAVGRAGQRRHRFSQCSLRAGARSPGNLVRNRQSGADVGRGAGLRYGHRQRHSVRLHCRRRAEAPAETAGGRSQSARPGLALDLPGRGQCAGDAGSGPAGQGLRAKPWHGVGGSRARCCPDEKSGQSDHRLGENRARAFRAAPGDDRAPGWRQRGGDFRVEGRRARGGSCGDPDQPDSLTGSRHVQVATRQQPRQPPAGDHCQPGADGLWRLHADAERRWMSFRTSTSRPSPS